MDELNIKMHKIDGTIENIKIDYELDDIEKLIAKKINSKGHVIIWKLNIKATEYENGYLDFS